MKVGKRLRQWKNKMIPGRKDRQNQRRNREIRANFIRHAVRNDIDSATRTPASHRRAKNRAAAKRAKMSRKKNRKK